MTTKELIKHGAKVHSFRSSPFVLCVTRAGQGSQDSMDLLSELIQAYDGDERDFLLRAVKDLQTRKEVASTKEFELQTLIGQIEHKNTQIKASKAVRPPEPTEPPEPPELPEPPEPPQPKIQP